MTQAIDPREVVFMAAVERSERNLRAIQRGLEMPCTLDELRLARKDALKAFARDLPDPASYAMEMDAPLAEALVRAEQGLDREICGAWCISASSSHLLPYLRSMGLVHVQHRTLTDFGLRVRAELLEDER